jgi:osmotically-inducible protein OsmY
MKNSFTLSRAQVSKALLITFLFLLLAGCFYPEKIKTVSYSDDLAITRNIQTQYSASAIVPHTVRISTNNHVVQLSGFVTSKEQALEAERIAKLTAGVRKVINYLVITTSRNVSNKLD